MTNFTLGIIALAFSIFLFFFSSKEKYNMLGYKSLQLKKHKDVWKWTNQCFGLLTLIGSISFLVFLSILKIQGEGTSLSGIKVFLYYILFCFVITECYAYIQRKKATESSKNL